MSEKKQPDDEFLDNLDFLLNMDIVSAESDWESFEQMDGEDEVKND